jgi:Translation initiation factor IF-2, N-terminal region
MAKLRVYELARELGVGNKAVMDQLKEMGEFVRSPSSTIELPLVRRLRDAFAAKPPEQDQQPGRSRQPARQAGISSPSYPGTETKSLSDSATPGKPPAGPTHELVENWNLAERLAPDRSLAVRFLADQSKLATFDIDRVRRVRNQCSHPADLGWPHQYDFDMALTTARELRRRLNLLLALLPAGFLGLVALDGLAHVMAVAGRFSDPGGRPGCGRSGGRPRA